MISGVFLYFAFGALLDERKMIEIDARCEKMGLARADGQRLTFTAGGVANLKPDPESSTWGVLWLVPADKMADLNRWAQARGMKRGVVTVVSPAGPRVPSTAYFDRGAAEDAPDASEFTALLLEVVRLGMNKDYLTDLVKRFGN